MTKQDNQKLKVFLVTRKADWCEDYATAVLAVDKLHTERCARCNSDNFRKGKVDVTEQNPKLSDSAKTQQEELADMIGISVDTLNNYKKTHRTGS